ncbi:hypothetical protein CROQUDRAFT_88142 [Cronartium quercuum f. sp. fusiforme G11]|uniref:ATP-dependent DNA helicase n=1 Tax=Cronartium quercuum f. sp. fusiforme G11 TaxID=708437 RepID=A0A9P6NVK7_9BASI|nr:hypothetical protein CROQUDRAFT_88142 [Cronartium quercuum f. sp. fusiforme G11]
MDDIIEHDGDSNPITAATAAISSDSQMNHKSPPKIQITPEIRARIEENRLKAEAIKANLRQAQNALRLAEAEKKRTAGELRLKEFGLKPRLRQQYLIPVPDNPDPIQQMRMADQIERTISCCSRQAASQPYVPDPRCSAEQLRVLDEVRLGRNVFFTGSAGVGKSFLLKEMVRMLKAAGRSVSVTAPTGIAALAIEGTTIYSWARIGLGHNSVHELYNSNSRGKRSKSKPGANGGDIMSTDVLIVDEVSMLHPELFEKLSLLCQAIRGVKSPFGGITCIFSGDMFQLPPVSRDENFSCMWCGCTGLRRDQSKGTIQCVRPFNKDWKGTPCGRERPEYTFCFETPTWRELNLSVIELKKVFRQEDKYFIENLNKIRWGKVDEFVEDLMMAHSKPLQEHQIKPTRLYPKNQNVDVENSKQFNLLEGEAYSFAAFDTVSQSKYAQSFVSRLNDLQARKQLQLKIGTQVILLANLDVGGKLVNGSRGVVIDWRQRPDYEIHNDGSKHRDEALREAGRIAWSQMQNHTCLPEVLFSDGRAVIIEPYVWKLEIDSNTLLTRTQIPLSHAWALTIHKSQGQSLDRLCVDLRGVFEYGQAYVALSRARSLEGLEVNSWHASTVRANPLVQKFYSCITDGTPYGDPCVPFRNLEDFFPCSDDGLRPSVFLRPNVPKLLPPINKTWDIGIETTSTAGPSAPGYHDLPGLKLEPEVIDLISPEPSQTDVVATQDPANHFEDEEWNVSTQMSISSAPNSTPLVRPQSHQEESPGLDPHVASGSVRLALVMERCTAHVANALTQIAEELAVLPEHERELFDLESLANHAARVIRYQLSNTRPSPPLPIRSFQS